MFVLKKHLCYSKVVSSISLFIDGSSLGNPGPDGAGVVLKDAEGKIIKKAGFALGKTTNNVAEYSACLIGLWEAKAHGAKELTVYSDSELLVRQVNGQYKVKDENLKVLHSLVKIFSKNFEKISFHHIPREKNELADSLANGAAASDSGHQPKLF